METETYLAQSLRVGDLHVQYDEHARNILKDKDVLAFILTHCVDEFRGYSREEAIHAISNDIQVHSREVAANTASSKAEVVETRENESKIPGEGTVYFDIVFTAWLKTGDSRKLYINLEAQKTAYPGYDLVSRSIVYAARLISQQMGAEYDGKHYDSVRKVYSIWICMNTPDQNSKSEDVADSIVQYALAPRVLYARNHSINVAFGRYDLISSIFINLRGDKTRKSENELIRMLSILFSTTVTLQVKKGELEKLGLRMSKTLEKEAAAMCNLSEAITNEKIESLEQQLAGAELLLAQERKQNVLKSKQDALKLKNERKRRRQASESLKQKDEYLKQKDEEIAMLKAALAAKGIIL